MKIHLGCGANLMPGWDNLDLDPPPGGIKADLSKRLPYADGSVSFAYTEHFIEHLTRDQALLMVKEVHRCLMPGGVLRISTPDLHTIIDAWTYNRLDVWRAVGWLPVNACQLVNEGLRSWGHQYVYDFEDLFLLLRQSGFQSIERLNYLESSYPELDELECRPYCGDLIIEAKKS